MVLQSNKEFYGNVGYHKRILLCIVFDSESRLVMNGEGLHFIWQVVD